MTRQCQARTWDQLKGLPWAAKGCGNPATQQIAGKWSCTLHVNRPPKNGWN